MTKQLVNKQRILVSQKNKLYLLESEATKLRIYYQSKNSTKESVFFNFSHLSCLESDESKKLFEKILGVKEMHERFIFTVVNFKNRILKFLNSEE